MTFAWYGHLKFKDAFLYHVVFISWGIAFLEYCLQVPANHMGHKYFLAVELKTMQEVIILLVFVLFSVTYFCETLKWNHRVEFALIVF